jgi:threonine synthase
MIDMVTDEEILEAYRMIAAAEGVFCEPASASSLAGLIKCVKSGYFKNALPVKAVCILTGHGLKDPDTAVANAVKPKKVKTNIKDIIKAINL